MSNSFIDDDNVVLVKHPAVFVYDGDDGVVAFYYCPFVPLKMHDIKNKTLKDYEDPADDNYDPLRVIKERMALEELNGSQII